MIPRRQLFWRLCYAAVVVLSVITFTPLVTPQGVFRPVLFGIPYTLWMGILITIGLVVLTFVATHVYPPNESEGGPSA